MGAFQNQVNVRWSSLPSKSAGGAAVPPGSALLRHAEQALESLGCVKINVQTMEENVRAQAFYSASGYTVEKRISLGKMLGRQS